MKVYVLNTGKIKNDVNKTYAHKIIATKQNPAPVAQWLEVPTYAVLIEHPTAGWILYDTGSHPDSDKIWTESFSNAHCYIRIDGATMQEQLGVLGLKPSDIDHVIISHMHSDHIGNIRLFKDTADFYVSRLDAEEAFTKVCATPDRSKHGAYNKEDVLLEVKSLNYIDEDEELFPGIDAFILPGHTRGTLGILLHLEDRNIILGSDAVFGEPVYSGEYMPGGMSDSLGFEKSLRKVKRLEKKYDADVWFSHDMEQFKRLKKIPEYYK